ncbi:ladderlectin-like [Oncorhynchus masou masou]|uniref:ladderlectin-like n=1 Tax=Oncorhynchus masou masou TaxID=90313 RepID=UPI0031837C92
MAMLTILLLLSAAIALSEALTLDEANAMVASAANKKAHAPQTGSSLIHAASCLSRLQGHGLKQRHHMDVQYRHCMFLGANLASVHSSRESQFLQAVVLIKTGDFPLTWIGGYDAVQANVEKDRLWFWSDGSTFNHQNWAEDEPNNYNGAREPCVQMNFGGKDAWNDELCERRYPSVCSIRTCSIRQTIN